MEKEIKAIIFDAGGVLFTTNWRLIRDKIKRKYGFSIFLYSDYPFRLRNKYKGLHTGQLSFKKLIKDLSKSKNITGILKYYKRLYRKAKKLNKKLFNVIKKLKTKYTLFCLTNTNDFHLQINREQGLFKNFKKTHSSCELGFKKPDKRAFFAVIKENNFPKEKILFIDNKKENIRVAKKIGMQTILFKNNNQFIKDLKKLGVKI